MTETFLKSSLLLFVLINPFSMSVYLIDLIQSLTARTFMAVLARATAISVAVFAVCAIVGDAIFEDILQARFSSFMIFGGIIFLIVGVRMVLRGGDALKELRGTPEHLAGSVAMPFMIGPGTISASILAGGRLPPALAILAIVAALLATVVGLLALKAIHDRIKERNQAVVGRYLDVSGRVMALITGTIAVDMILNGIGLWLGNGPGT